LSFFYCFSPYSRFRTFKSPPERIIKNTSWRVRHVSPTLIKLELAEDRRFPYTLPLSHLLSKRRSLSRLCGLVIGYQRGCLSPRHTCLSRKRSVELGLDSSIQFLRSRNQLGEVRWSSASLCSTVPRNQRATAPLDWQAPPFSFPSLPVFIFKLFSFGTLGERSPVLRLLPPCSSVNRPNLIHSKSQSF